VSALPFAPYDADRDPPAPASVPVTGLVLTKDEGPNIVRCLASLAWCDQVVVIDSGSSDATVSLARATGALVVEQPWLGFAGQREFALRHPGVRNEWVYFVDADEWVSAALARETATAVEHPSADAYRQRFRLVFQGRWIAHCGWYENSWVVRLGRRGAMDFTAGGPVGERARVHGSVGMLRCDIVDEDLKGLAAWLRKHVSYAEAEALRRDAVESPVRERLRRWRRRERGERSAGRSLAKDVVLPGLPASPLWVFGYMYVLRGGWRDGHQGLVFCLLHAWFQLVVGELGRENRSRAAEATPGAVTPGAETRRGRPGDGPG
jgi:glycosyltransferase involved in cell wall biosynthesis